MGSAELYFNELSLQDGDECDFERIKTLILVVGDVGDYGISICRMQNDIVNRIAVFLLSFPNNQDAINLYNLLYAKFQDYFDDNVDDWSGWTYNGVACHGLALAHLNDTCSLSYLSPEWKCNRLEIIRGSEKAYVRNVSTFEQVEELKEFFEGLLPTKLRETEKNPNDKVHIAKHHGNNILKEKANILKNSKYVEDIRSTEFAHYKVHNPCVVSGEGKIVMYFEGYLSLEVITTGANRRETEEIAKILKRQVY